MARNDVIGARRLVGRHRAVTTAVIRPTGLTIAVAAVILLNVPITGAVI